MIEVKRGVIERFIEGPGVIRKLEESDVKG